MKKALFLSVLFVLAGGRLFGQNWTTVTAANITDLNQQKLAAGQLCFLGTDQNDNPISFNVGGGGQVLRRAFCALVSSGAVTGFTVPNPAQTTPAGVFYRVTVKDSSTGQEVLRYTQVTFNGTAFNFDNYAPLNVGQVSPPGGNAVSGNLSVNGNASITGALTAGSFGAINAGTNTIAGSIFQVPGAANLQIDTNRFGALGVRVQSIGVNATQALTVMPSGSANETTFRLHNTSDPLNTGALQLDLTGTNASLGGIAFGAGSAPTMFTLSGMGLQVGATDTALSRTAAGVVAVGSGTAGNSSGTFEGRKLQLDGSASGNTGLQSAAAASGTLTLPSTTDTLVGKATTDTLTNKTLNGAGSGNGVTLLNSQDGLAAVTGNGTDQVLYSFTIPANTIQGGKGFRIRWGLKNNNPVGLTIKTTIGATTLWTVTSTGAANHVTGETIITNKSGVQNAQNNMSWIFDSTSMIGNDSGGTTLAENFANAITVKVTVNVASPNTYKPNFWIVDLLQ